MPSMYCGVPWPSSFRDFSYFSLVYEKVQAHELKTNFHSARFPLTESERAQLCTALSLARPLSPSTTSESIGI